MKIYDNTSHVRKIQTTLEHGEIEEILLAHVAKQAGVSMGDGFSGRAYHSARDTSTGVYHDYKVEIQIDLTKLPTVLGGE